jgi:hypothetical protein
VKSDSEIERKKGEFKVLRAMILLPVCLLCTLPGLGLIWFGYKNAPFVYCGFLVISIGLLYGPLLLLGRWWIPQNPLKIIFREHSREAKEIAEHATPSDGEKTSK